MPLKNKKPANYFAGFFYEFDWSNLNVFQIDNFLFRKHSPVTSW
jgi:hypothetical protein